jgi:hypothetical protein
MFSRDFKYSGKFAVIAPLNACGKLPSEGIGGELAVSFWVGKFE